MYFFYPFSSKSIKCYKLDSSSLSEAETSRRNIGTSGLTTSTVCNCLFAILSTDCKLSIYLDESGALQNHSNKPLITSFRKLIKEYYFIFYKLNCFINFLFQIISQTNRYNYPFINFIFSVMDFIE